MKNSILAIVVNLKVKHKILYLIFFFSYSLFCQEREATIVFNDSSSVKGFGEIKNEKIYFRVDLKSEKSKWSYDSAKALIFSGYGFSETYEYIKPDKYSEPILMEVIEEGNVNLYRKSSYGLKVDLRISNKTIGPIGDYSHSSTYYVKRINETNATDITFSFKSRASRYFADCIEVVNKIKSKEFNSNKILEMVYFYNDYCGKEE